MRKTIVIFKDFGGHFPVKKWHFTKQIVRFWIFFKYNDHERFQEQQKVMRKEVASFNQ